MRFSTPLWLVAATLLSFPLWGTDTLSNVPNIPDLLKRASKGDVDAQFRAGGSLLAKS